MTADIFINCKHFPYWGFIPPLDLTNGGRYTHITTCRTDTNNDKNLYDIVSDDNMNFFYIKHFKNNPIVFDVVKKGE